MTINTILSRAVQGMSAQSVRLATIASNVANRDTPGYNRLSTTLTDEQPGVSAAVREAASGEGDVEDMTGMIEAREGFEANARVFETGASIWDMLPAIKRD